MAEKKILCIADGGIGNVVLATPLVIAIKELFKRSQITFGTRPPCLPIVSGLVDHILDVTKDEFEKYYDMVLCTIWHSYFLKRKDEIKFDYFDSIEYKAPPVTHEVDLNMRLLDSFGFKNRRNPKPYCNEKYCDMYINKNIINIGIANGKADDDNWERKKWPHLYEFLKYLRKNFKKEYCVYLFGGEREKKIFKKLDLEYNEYNIAGKLEIDEIAYLMKQMDINIVNDTGLGHVAGAVGAKTLVLWGPTSFKKNRHIGDEVYTVVSDANCIECQGSDRWHKCKEWRCMDRFVPEFVFKKMYELVDIQ